MQLLIFLVDLSGVVTTAPTSVPVPTTAAPELPVVNVTVQFPVTTQPTLANVTIPPIVEATTNLITDNVTEASDNKPPAHPGIV